MKIAIVINDLSVKGGAQRQAVELARELGAKGNKVDIFCMKLNKDVCYPQIIKSLNVYTPSHNEDKSISLQDSDNLIIKLIKFVHNLWYQRRANNKLAQLINIKNDKSDGYEVINFHDDTVELAKDFKSFKTVWMMNDLPSGLIDYERDPSRFTSFIKRLIISLLKFKYVISVKNINKIIVLDKRNAHLVKKYFGRKAMVIRSGVDIRRFDLRDIRQKPTSSHHKILSVNIFFKYRRYEDLIEALNILVNEKKMRVELDIVGKEDTDPEYTRYIKNLVKDYNIGEYVNFLGVVEESKLLSEYKKADIFVFPNHNQTWGLSVFEAMLNYCACVVSKGSGAHEVLKDGENALLVNPKAPQELAEKIFILLKNNKLRRKIAIQGHDFVIQNLSWSKYSNAMMRQFQLAIRQRS